MAIAVLVGAVGTVDEFVLLLLGLPVLLLVVVATAPLEARGTA